MHVIKKLRQDIKSSRRRMQVAIAKCRKVGAANWGNSTKKADGGVYEQKPKRAFRGKAIRGEAVARGCGAVMNGRRKRTKGSVSQA